MVAVGLAPRDAPGSAPDQARRQRCLAALLADPRLCEGELKEVRVIDQTGRGTTAWLLHGAVLLAWLEGGRVYPLNGGPGPAIEVRLRADAMRPLDFLTGPGVQCVTTLDEVVVFPHSPGGERSTGELRSACSRLGNAPASGWGQDQRYQVSHVQGRAAGDSPGGVQPAGCQEVPTR